MNNKNWYEWREPFSGQLVYRRDYIKDGVEMYDTKPHETDRMTNSRPTPATTKAKEIISPEHYAKLFPGLPIPGKLNLKYHVKTACRNLWTFLKRKIFP